MADSGSSGKKDSIIILVVLLINMGAMGFFGYYFWQKHKKDELAQKAKDAAAAALAPKTDEKSENSYTVKVVRFESLITNLEGDNGRREVRLSLEAKCEGDGVLDEINRIKPKIRDALITLITSATPEEVTTAQGKEELKKKILEQINSMLTHGKLTEVYFTELELN
jgi:flagellar FliL protein